MTDLKTIKIFLASSSELKEDREQFEIFINRKNKQYIIQGIFLELVIWEDFLDTMSATRLQDEYNKAISEADIFVSLFATKVGQYTQEEVMTAWETFKQKGKPLIYTYFKDEPINTSQITSEIYTLLNFKEKLNKLGHFYTRYNNIDDLKYKFSEQLIKIVQKLIESLVEKPTLNRSKPLKAEKLEAKIERKEQAAEAQKPLKQIREKIKQRIASLPVKIFQENKELYQALCDSLEKKNWREADAQANQIILKLIDKEDTQNITSKDLEKISCQALLEIELLWLAASNNHFGWTVQRQIWLQQFKLENLDKKQFSNPNNILKFRNFVGWNKGDRLLNHRNDYIFSLEAPQGHLPSLRFSCSEFAENNTNWEQSWKRIFSDFLLRIEKCLL